MITFYQKYAKNFMHSQNGEEGIVLECFLRMGVKAPVMCEFGAHNGKYCSNTRYFVDICAGRSLMLECDSNLFEDLQNGSRFSDIIAIRDSVNKININKYLSFLPHNFDLLSIDTDGDNDYECLEAMKARPKIVIVEINSSFGPEVVGRKDCYSEMVGLALTWKGYFLLCHTGNLVFVDNKYKELFPELLGTNGISNPELYFNTSWLTK